MRTLRTPEPVGQVGEKIRRGNVALDGCAIGELRHKRELVSSMVNAQNVLPMGFARRTKSVFRGLAAQVIGIEPVGFINQRALCPQPRSGGIKCVHSACPPAICAAPRIISSPWSAQLRCAQYAPRMGAPLKFHSGWDQMA